VLEADVKALWAVPAGGFPASGGVPGEFLAFPLGGTIGIGGNDRFIAHLTFTNGVGGLPIGPPIDIDKTYLNATAAPLPFTDLIGITKPLNGGVPLAGGTQIYISGTIQFRAKNDESPSDIHVTGNGGSVSTALVPLPPAWVSGLLGIVALVVAAKLRSALASK
jgi:hypothetical protein